MAERGLRVSVSTLSNWQRGLSRPERAGSRLAVGALDVILDLPTESLARLLTAAPRARRPNPGTPREPANRLKAELDAPERSPLTVLSTHDDLTVGSDWLLRNRLVVQARRTGVDRHVMLFHTRDGALPELIADRGCRLGRVLTDDPAGLIAAELLFPALHRGETYPIEYQVRGLTPESSHGRWFASGGRRYELTVRFTPAADVRAAHRIWRLDRRAPHKDVTGLRLIDGIAHLLVTEPTPGFHGVRWEG